MKSKKGTPSHWTAFLESGRNNQRLLNWGAQRAALRPYFLRAPDGAAVRGPRRIKMLRANELPLRQGFALWRKTLVRRTAPPHAVGPRSARSTKKQPVQMDRLFWISLG